MPLVRVAAVYLAVLALAGGAQAAVHAPAYNAGAKLSAPTAVRAFLPGYPAGGTTFPRTPAFAWNPARGAARYELALSTSPLFPGNAIVWDDSTVKTPVAAVPIALPWITGTPHSLYARVRAIAANGAVGPWSVSYGFDIRWVDNGIPQPLSSPNGLVRWQPIDGATAYQVWFLNVNVADSDGNPSGSNKIFTTSTNVADEREYYTFHQPTLDPTGHWAVLWRVRAVRTMYGVLNNALPTVTYGPWSPPYVNENSAFATGPFTGLTTYGEPAVPGHDPWKDGFRQTPGFAFSGNTGQFGPASLYRVYVYSDRDCVNPVFKGSLVGSPAYAPRVSGPLAFPTDPLKLGKLLVPWFPDAGRLVDAPITSPDGTQTSHAADNGSSSVDERESQSPATFTGQLLASPTSSSSSSSAPPSSSTGAAIVSLTGAGAPTGLWDTNWPVGRYYWTVVAAHYGIVGGTTPHVDYWDEEVPQDVCGGRFGSFGMASQPAATVSPASHVPYVWGLSPTGGLRSASASRPTFAGVPLVGWQPALAATAYEVQWSKKAYPWRPYGNLYTYSTATTLPLTAGTWYYRVRGINMSLPTGASTMAWSQKVGLVVARPKFSIGK